MKKLVKIILIGLIFSMLLSSCSFESIIDRVLGKPLNNEHNFFSVDDSFFELPFSCQYRSIYEDSALTMTFDIDDVTLDFYFGPNARNAETLEKLRNISSYPEFDIYFSNDNGSKIHIKHIDENIVSEKYMCEQVLDLYGNVISAKYHYWERLSIPEELFVGESGEVFFSVQGKNINNEDPTQEWIIGRGFAYRVDGDKVYLGVDYLLDEMEK